MSIRTLKKNHFYATAVLITGIVLFLSCTDDNNELAQYAGAPQLSTITVEGSSFMPKITWVGGYVSVIGVNKGNKAILDSTLVMLASSTSDDIKYPVKFGEVPTGAQNIVAQFGGTASPSLNEDEIYTYWVMKLELWNQLSGQWGKFFEVNDELTNEDFRSVGDSLVEVSPKYFTVAGQRLDVYVNVTDVKTFGKLGLISVSQPVDSLGPIISWTITQEDVTDQNISAMGLVESQGYNEAYQLWNLWSHEVVSGENIYGKKNVISFPIRFGDKPEGTKTFIEYPAGGIERNKEYYVWIANDQWDGASRTRVTRYYAYVTFTTW